MKRLFYGLCVAAAVAVVGTAYLAGRQSQTEVSWQITQEPVVGLADSITAKQLGQLRPANTNAASIYSPAAGVTTRITAIVISNTGGNPRAFRLFHDDDGTTYGETTALYWDEALAADTTKNADNELQMHRRSTSGSWTSQQDVSNGTGTRSIVMVAEADDLPQARGPAQGEKTIERVRADEEIAGEEGRDPVIAVLPDLDSRQIGLQALALQEATNLLFLTRLGV